MNPLDDFRSLIESEIAAGRTYTDLAAQMSQQGYPCSRHAIRRAVKRWKHDPLNQMVTSPQETSIDITLDGDYDVQTLCRERGLNPDEWEVSHFKTSRWDSPTGDSLESVHFSLRRKQSAAVIPAREPGRYQRPKPQKKQGKRLVALFSDHHAPFHDEALHDATLSWLEHNQPDEAVIMGDLLDLPDISRHRKNPAWQASTQDCVNAGYSILLDYVERTPKTTWTFLAGNHEERLRNTLIDYVPDVAYLTPGAKPGEQVIPALSMSNLLRLDELAIECEVSRGRYFQAKHILCDTLAVIHGDIATKGSGATAWKALDKYQHSIVQGHTHRLSQIFKTIYNVNGNPTTITGVETGCMCVLEENLGHTVNADWQSGMATVAIHEDDSFKIDLGTFYNNKLYWQNHTYS